jgi:hypothetical protein
MDKERIYTYTLGTLILVAALASTYTAVTAYAGYEKSYEAGFTAALGGLQRQVNDQELASYSIGNQTTYCVSEETITTIARRLEEQSTTSPN